MRIALGADHGGYRLKEEVKKHLEKKGFEVIDCGTNSTESVDYPKYASAVGQAVLSGEAEQGILVCGTGIGISIAANKIPGIRAALCSDTFSARMAREHNNANVLAFGARVIGPGLALDIVDAFLAADFTGGRHARRVDMLSALERGERL